MQMNGKKNRSWLLYFSILLLTSAAVVLCVLFVHLYSESTVRASVYNEMHTTAETQTEIIRHEIEEQFKPLKMLAEYIKDETAFQGEECRQILEALKKENRFCALGFADRNGDAVNYDGEAIGNIAERDYFSRIVSGEKEETVEYLPVTKRVQEPRFLFSVPVYDAGKIVGVLFSSKEVSVISDVLLGETLFDGSERIYITDAEYNVLAANRKGTEEMQNRDLSSEFRFVRESSTQNQSSGGFILDDEEYVTSIPVGINQWQMVCVLDKDHAEGIYADVTGSLKNVANTVSAILIAVLLYTLLMTHYRVSRYKKGEQQMFTQYSSYRTLLEKLDCAVVEYNVKSDSLTANQLFMEKYVGNEPGNRPFSMKKLQKIHPEFNFKELDEAIRIVQRNNHPYAFETAITFTDGKVYWIEITLMPQTDLNAQITDILAAVIDTTKAHEGSDSEETLSSIPNGIHRCYLCEPIHMEFASKGMCQMLGYTEEELAEKITPDRKLGWLVHPDDREKFSRFVREAAKKEGRYHCEYRMQKKDGLYISVFDLMEVKREASGVMYGYSSVTDITDFQKAEELANARLRAAEEEIEKHIFREQKIIAAKEEAEEKYRKEALQLLEKSHMAQEEANRLVRAISSINSDYSAIYFVDLDREQYQLCRSNEMLRKPVQEIIRGKKRFSATLREYIDNFVEKEDRQRMIDETAVEAIQKRLSESEQFFVRYRLKENSSGQVHYEMHIVDCSIEAEEHKAAIGFRCLDAAIAEEDKHRQEVEELENRLRTAQLKNSMSQMQPHFLYNALASIREIVLDDPQYASDLLFDFSTHLRACIRAMSHNDLVPFKQELENINAYVNIEKMRFGEKLRTRFEIADKEFSIVPLSIQPLVENAIRHGIYERGAKGGTVTVATEQTEKYHEIRVSDDGVGFDYEQICLEVQEKKRDSTGLTNLIFRLKKIMNAEVNVNSTQGIGTVVTVRIPKEQEKKSIENDSCR